MNPLNKTRLLVIGLLLQLNLAASGQSPAPAAETIRAENAVLKVVEERRVPARTSGIISDSRIRESMIVEAQQFLMQIDNTMSQAELSKAQKEFDMAKLDAESDVDLEFSKRSIEVAEAELERALRSNRRRPGVVPQTELDQLSLIVKKTIAEKDKTEFQMQMRAMNRDVRQIELDIERLKNEFHQIQSPMAGMIVEVYRRQGEWVETSEPVARLIRLDTLKTEIKLPADQALDNLMGAVATFYPALESSSLQESYPGKVTFIYPEANPVSSEVRVWVEIENENLKLIPGLTGRVEIQKPSSPPALQTTNE